MHLHNSKHMVKDLCNLWQRSKKVNRIHIVIDYWAIWPLLYTQNYSELNIHQYFVNFKQFNNDSAMHICILPKYVTLLHTIQYISLFLNSLFKMKAIFTLFHNHFDFSWSFWFSILFMKFCVLVSFLISIIIFFSQCQSIIQ